MAIDSTLVMNQYLYSHLPYDPVKDFVPITVVAKTMDLLVVNASSDIKTAKDLVAKAKAQPGKLNCGAGTITTKLTCVLFNEKAGVDTVLLPYNGSAEVAHGILTKSVDFVFDGPSAVLPLVQVRRSARARQARPRPLPAVPDLPTLKAATGIDLGEITVWLGLVAPHGTPSAIVDKLAAEMAKILNDPQVKARADSVGHFSGNKHTRRIRSLHPAGSRALAGGRQKERHAFRLARPHAKQTVHRVLSGCLYPLPRRRRRASDQRRGVIKLGKQHIPGEYSDGSSCLHEHGRRDRGEPSPSRCRCGATRRKGAQCCPRPRAVR